ncbi:MAG: ComF family protein [Streptococcaceae bacterium]|jgi:ComF family protein|nr:ComF family protein [Streptococcaceae bacterium]
MNCLLCNRDVPQNLQFHDLFLLRQTQSSLCARCRAQFEKIPNAHCPRCYKPGTSSLCNDCKRWESQGVPIQHTAVFSYTPAMHDYFSHYKFIGDFRLRGVFAPYFKQLPKGYTPVPIPVSQKRLQERGFNQVTAFLDAEKIPYTELLQKSETLKQSSLSRTERLATKNPFFVAPNLQIPSKICLVDDIYTTGATLVHARETLKKASPKTDIISFSLCR